MEFVNTFWALVPAIVAIVLALITKEVYSSLFIGILVGALLLTGFDPIGTVDAIISGTFVPTGGTEEDAITTGLIPALADSAGIFVFLVMLGILVALISVTGASAAFGTWAAKHVKSRVGSQLATFALGVLIFVDDYFNCLTVGSVMRPVTDEHNVSRAKLAYLIDATAAPVCMIAPVSSWAAAVSGVASDLNVDGIQLFVSAIPFNFYSLLTLLFVVVIVVMGFDYGPMAKSEMEAIREGRIGSLGNDEPVVNTRARLWDMLIPVVVLIVFCIVGMLYVGGFWDPAAEGYQSLILAFGNTDAFLALPWGSLIALVFTFVYLLLPPRGEAFRGVHAAPDRQRLQQPWCRPSSMLTFAVALKNMTGLLGADVFVAGLMENVAPGLFNLLPARHLPGGAVPGLLHRHQLGHLRYPHPHRDAHLRERPHVADHRHLRLPGGRGGRRPLLAHLRHHGHGLGRRRHAACGPREHPAALRHVRGGGVLRDVRPGGLRPKRPHLPAHRRRAGDRRAVRAA